jgi:WD40 repeat protein
VYQSFEDDFQNLAIGLRDGALIIIDLILGLEKHFLEKHPMKVTSIAFFEDKAIISGSVDGRVNLSDIENLNNKKGLSKLRSLKCQNLMDRKVPVAKVETSNDMAIGMAVDIEGNCRFYDLIRFKKMAKIGASE